MSTTPQTQRSRLTPRAAGWVWALPTAFAVVVAVAVALAESAALVGWRPLTSQLGAACFLAALVVVGVVATFLLARDERPIHGWWLGCIPALALVGYAVGARFLSEGHRAEWFIGGDNVRHLLYATEIERAGNLSYASQVYPRAWHTVVATLWSATGGQQDGAGFRSLVDVMSTATWLLPGVVSLAMASAATALGSRLGLTDSRAAWAGLVAAVPVLLPPFLGDYQARGFQTSYLGAVLLALALRLALVRPTAARLVGAGASVVVCAHTWQLLLPPVGLALLVVTAALVRSRGRSAWALAGVVWAATGAAAWPALFAVSANVGVGHAAVSEVVAPAPRVLLVVGLMVTIGLAWQRRRDVRLLHAAAVVALPALTAWGLTIYLGTSLSDYYPSKLLWQSALLALAPLAVAACLLHQRLGRGLAARLGRTAIVTAGVVLVASGLLAPVAAFVGAWSSVHGGLLLRAVSAPAAGRAQVVWLGDTADDTYARVLLDFYGTGTTLVRTPQAPQGIAGDCELLRASAAPAVLTDRPAPEVLRRYACVPGVGVVPVPPR